MKGKRGCVGWEYRDSIVLPKDNGYQVAAVDDAMQMVPPATVPDDASSAERAGQDCPSTVGKRFSEDTEKTDSSMHLAHCKYERRLVQMRLSSLAIP